MIHRKITDVESQTIIPYFFLFPSHLIFISHYTFINSFIILYNFIYLTIYHLFYHPSYLFIYLQSFSSLYIYIRIFVSLHLYNALSVDLKKKRGRVPMEMSKTSHQIGRLNTIKYLQTHI